MKDYFVTADIHGYYDEFLTALTDAGFDEHNPNHYLIICGDIFDRGLQAKELLNFLYDFSQTGRLLLIRGNHEDLFDECMYALKHGQEIRYHHLANGTVDTIAQLTGTNPEDIVDGGYRYRSLRYRLAKYYKLLRQAKDFYEIDNYVFVHGWIPKNLENIEDYPTADAAAWRSARWDNGIESANNGYILKDKIIVCGHFHTSWGWAQREPNRYTEWGATANFGIYQDEGILALDACTAYTNKVNILHLTLN